MKKLPLSVGFILVTVFLDSMGIGLIMPVLPLLISEVQSVDFADAALFGGLLGTIYAAMQFLFGPVLGNLSDQYGRRVVLLGSLALMAADYLFLAAAWSFSMLLLGRTIGGVAAATHATANAYMADISKPEDKAANFGLIGAAFGLGFVFGPVIGGLLESWGSRAPFYAAAVLAAANFLFGFFVLPETVTDAIRRPFEFKRANPFAAFYHIGNLPRLGRLLLIVLISSIAFGVYPAVWAFFGMERFGWSPQMVGVSLGFFGIFMAFSQAFLIRPMIKRFGEARTVLIGFSLDVLAFAFLGVVTNGWLALAITPIVAAGSIAGPAIQGLMSRATPDNQQGELQGALTAINAIAMIVAPVTMTQIFGFFSQKEEGLIYLPGAPFVLSSILALICIAVFAGQPSVATTSSDMNLSDDV